MNNFFALLVFAAVGTAAALYHSAADVWRLHDTSYIRSKLPFLQGSSNKSVALPSLCLQESQHVLSGHLYHNPCLPSIYMIGPQKTGTTDMFMRLMRHPDAVEPARKEPHYWSRYANDTFRVHRYISKFYVDYVVRRTLDPADHAFTVDASATYFYANRYMDISTAQLIYAHSSQSRILVLLRNPIDRTRSDFFFFGETCNRTRAALDLTTFDVNVRRTVESFGRCITDKRLRFHEDVEEGRAFELDCALQPEFSQRGRSNCDNGRPVVSAYAIWLQEWLRVWPRAQLAIFRLEDYDTDPTRFMSTVLTALNLRRFENDSGLYMENIVAQSHKRVGRNVSHRGIFKSTFAFLTDFFQPYNERLARMLGDDRYLWNDI